RRPASSDRKRAAKWPRRYPHAGAWERGTRNTARPGPRAATSSLSSRKRGLRVGSRGRPRTQRRWASGGTTAGADSVRGGRGDDDSAALVKRWTEGDERAAAELVNRYTGRLLALARSHLSAKLAARLDPEDVVQSAYRSFFADARDDRFVLKRSGDLWRLLAAITLHKLQH